jgi:Ca2+-transporting ATPase
MVLLRDNFVRSAARTRCVCLTHGCRSIVEAVEEGRTVYANISKFVFYLLSTNVSEVFTILICTAFLGLQSPLEPIQILWLNLVTPRSRLRSSASLTAVAVHRRRPRGCSCHRAGGPPPASVAALTRPVARQSEPGIMDEGPRSKDEPLLERLMLTGILLHVMRAGPSLLRLHCDPRRTSF